MRGVLRVLLTERRDSGFLLSARLFDKGAHSRNLAATCPLDEARQLGDGALRVVVLLFTNREFLLQFCDLFASEDGHGVFASS